MDAYDRINEELERQEEELAEMLACCEISQTEYNKRMKQLQREAREELRYVQS